MYTDQVAGRVEEVKGKVKKVAGKQQARLSDLRSDITSVLESDASAVEHATHNAHAALNQAVELRLRSTPDSPTALLLAAGAGILLGRIHMLRGAASAAGPSIAGDVVRALILAFVR